jgi:hypothetical protein
MHAGTVCCSRPFPERRLVLWRAGIWRGYRRSRGNVIPEAFGRFGFISFAMMNPAPEQAMIPSV